MTQAVDGRLEKVADNLGTSVMLLVAMNTTGVLIAAVCSPDFLKGLPAFLAVLVPVGTAAGGLLIALGIHWRWRWAWTVTVFACGSILLWCLVMAGWAVIDSRWAFSVFPLLGGGLFGGVPLRWALRVRPLFFQTEEVEEECRLP